MNEYKKEKTIKLTCDTCGSAIEGRWVATERDLYLFVAPCSNCMIEAGKRGYEEGVKDR